MASHIHWYHKLGIHKPLQGVDVPYNLIYTQPGILEPLMFNYKIYSFDIDKPKKVFLKSTNTSVQLLKMDKKNENSFEINGN